MKEIIRKYLWVILTVLLLPLGLYGLIKQPWGFDAIGGEDAPKEWLGFWGGYIGAVISAVVSFFILNKQLEQNQKENNENRLDNQKENEKNRNSNEAENRRNKELQLNILEYQQQMQWLNNLKSKLSDYYMIFNYNNLSEIGDLVISRNSEKMKKAQGLMTTMSNNKASLDFTLGLLFSNKGSSNETNFLYKKAQFDLEFSALIQDLDWLIEITCVNYTGSIESSKVNIEEATTKYIEEERVPEITYNRIPNIMANYEYDIYNNYKKIVAERMRSVNNFDATSLQQAISIFIDYEQERINRIIKDTDNDTK